MTSFSRPSLRCILAFFVLLIDWPEGQARAGIVYQMNNYPNDQAGWTLSGSITTDGSLGYIGVSNIIAWNFSATNGASIVSANSSDPTSSIQLYLYNQSTPGAYLFATNSNLSMPDYGDLLYMGTKLFGSTETLISYYHTNVPAMSYVGFWDATYQWDSLSYDIGSNNFEIASGGTPITAVPEPSGFGMVGSFCVVAYYLGRRRRPENKASEC